MNRKNIKTLLSFLLLLAVIAAYVLFAVGLSNDNPNYILVPSLILTTYLVGKTLYLLISRDKMSAFDIVEACINFVAVIPLIITYIVSIPDDNLREVTSQFAAAILSGFFTLAGVGLTIKNTRLNRMKMI